MYQAYILLVVFHVNSGSIFTTQEFFSEDKCEIARQWIMRQPSIENAICVLKK